MRVERIILEHHRDAAFCRRKLIDSLPVDVDFAAIRLFKAGNQPKKGRFSAAGRPDKDREFFLFDLQIDIADDFDLVKPSSPAAQV